ncbi:MAG: hypothetical protein Q3976_00565 [Corynebacterium sp.]|nr:hypothetical protein [Corynebacterium sp.]
MDVAKYRQKVARGKIKKKCCKSNPRCKSCPVVIKRLQKMEAFALDDAQLAVAIKQARKK